MNRSQLLYSIPDAAVLLSISRAQIYRLIDKGELDSVLIGRSRRISDAQLAAFVDRLEQSRTHSLPKPPKIRFNGKRLRG